MDYALHKEAGHDQHRGVLDGFIAEVIEDHIREHMVDPSEGRETPQIRAAEELIEIVHQYLKK